MQLQEVSETKGSTSINKVLDQKRSSASNSCTALKIESQNIPINRQFTVKETHLTIQLT